MINKILMPTYADFSSYITGDEKPVAWRLGGEKISVWFARWKAMTRSIIVDSASEDIEKSR